MWCPSVRFSPLIETSPLASELDQILDTLQKFDTVAFTSRHGVDSVCDRMEALFGGVTAMLNHFERSGVRIAATANAAEAVRARIGAPPDILAEEEEELADALAATGRRTQARILCPSAAFLNLTAPPVASHAARAMAARGLSVVRAPAYLVRPGDARAHQPELSALAQGAVDVIGLTSAVEVTGTPPTAIHTPTQARLPATSLCPQIPARHSPAPVSVNAGACARVDERDARTRWEESQARSSHLISAAVL
jgi:uroporphyrinogen-III synthase